jgi:surface antigen
MTRTRLMSVVLVGAIALAGCTEQTGMSNTAGGAAIGAVSGAALGAAVGGRNRGTAALVGGLAGAAVGGLIGAQLDAQSEARRQVALTQLAVQAERERNFANSAPVVWANPQQNTSGQVRAKSRPAAQAGRRCMEVTETVTINGQPQQVDETRCQDSSGRWV